MTTASFGPIAPIKRRAIAYVVDALIAAAIPVLGLVIGVVLSFGPLRGEGSLAAVMAAYLLVMSIVGVLMLAWVVVYTLMQVRGGSIGMRSQGLRLADAATGAPLGFGRALLRNIVFGLAGSIVVGYFSPLFDGSGRFQGWHDKAAGALMLDARTGAPASAAPAGAQSAPPAPPLPGSAAPVPQGAPVPPPASGFAPAGPAGAPAPAHAAPTFAPPVPEAAAPAPAVSQPAPAAPAAPGADADPLIAFVPGITQRPSEVRAQTGAATAAEPAVPPAPPSPEPTPAAPAQPVLQPEDFDELEDTRISVPGHRLIFTWDDGTRVTVSRRTIFGRNPAEEPGAVVVAVRDETLSLSKTHFEAAAENSGGWLMDRDSTNGTVIVRDGVRIACTPGERVRIRLGDVIEIGDRVLTIGGYA